MKKQKKYYSQEEIIQLFKQAGMRMTNQRIAVFQEVNSHSSHPSVEEIYQNVRRVQPAISLNTVYRILQDLSAKKLLQAREDLAPQIRYDGNTENHHHFVCDQCGKIQDIYIPNIEELDISGCAEVVGQVEVRLRGKCKMCI